MATPTCLVVSPNVIDFKTVGSTCLSEFRTVHFVNTCNSPVAVSSVGLTGSRDFGLGGFMSDGGTPSTLISPGQSMPGAVYYRPSRIGTEVGSIRLTTTEPGPQNVEYSVTLLGNAALSGRSVETFTVPQTTDVLFVVDDSCSMLDKQIALGNTFTSFVGSRTGWQIGVTTTDGTVNGQLRGGVLTPSSPNLAASFSALIQAGTNGDATEAGLAGAIPFAKSANPLVRHDAALSVVFVTDAPDFSSYTTANATAALRAAKGGLRQNDVSLHGFLASSAIAPSPCDYEAVEDGRYSSAIAATGGHIEDVCAINATTVARLGARALGTRPTWTLSATPAAGVLATLNGASIPPALISLDGGVATFAPGFAPGPGDTVSFTYDTLCR